MVSYSIIYGLCCVKEYQTALIHTLQLYKIIKSGVQNTPLKPKTNCQKGFNNFNITHKGYIFLQSVQQISVLDLGKFYLEFRSYYKCHLPVAKRKIL